MLQVPCMDSNGGGGGGSGGFLYATSVCGRNVSNFGNKKSQNTHFIIKRFSFKSTILFNE